MSYLNLILILLVSFGPSVSYAIASGYVMRRLSRPQTLTGGLKSPVFWMVAYLLFTGILFAVGEGARAAGRKLNQTSLQHAN